jgi:methylated-DNA-[protein]-cysteine S-methyltransferase
VSDQTPDAQGEIDPATWERIRRRLNDAAEGEGLIDVAVERHDSPLGTLLVAATGSGLVRVGMPNEGEEAVLAELADRVAPRVLIAPRASVTETRRQLDEYFEGRRRGFEVDLDWRLARGFRRGVLEATARIPYGETGTYTSVATAAGSAKAVRAAGTALARNPIPIVIPCHRVLRSDGALGNYLGGPEAKAQLLDLEGDDRHPRGRSTHESPPGRPTPRRGA